MTSSVTLQAALPVSVIITCYNQARFLGEAIESALAQSYPNVEIIVVDDGSVDAPGKVAANYSAIKFIRQENRGVAAARNNGLRESRGRYVVFLDGDDRLRPRALEIGVAYLTAHPDCAFVSGCYQLIGPDGAPLPTEPQRCVTRDHYLQLLRSAYIWTTGAVLFRQSALGSAGGFNTSLSIVGCDDHELYLRLARVFPVGCHDQVVVEWRRHNANTSADPVMMLTSVLAVYRAHLGHVRDNEQYCRAYASGVRLFQAHYGKKIVSEALAHVRKGEVRQIKRYASTFLRYCLPGVLWHSGLKLAGLFYRQPPDSSSS